MSKLYKAICESSKKYAEMRAQMTQRGITVSYYFKDDNYEIAHIKKDNSYIVVKGTKEGPPRLLYTGVPVTNGPDNISATSAAQHFIMPIGTVQGLYFNDGSWHLCNSGAYDCTNLQWISPLTLIEIVENNLDLNSLDPDCAYTIIISTHDNNIFIEQSNDAVYIIGAVYTDRGRLFQPAPFPDKLIPLDEKYELKLSPNTELPGVARLNALLTQSTVKNFIADMNITMVYGVLSRGVDAYTAHFSQLGSTIIKITNNDDIKRKNIEQPNRYLYLLIKTIIGFNNQETLLRKHTSRHNQMLDKINAFIDEKAKKIGELPTNFRDVIVQDDFMPIFYQKYSEVIKQMPSEVKTVRDLLLAEDFIPLYLKELQ